MKKIIAWLTKGSKVVRILTYVYRGVFVSRRMLSSMLVAFKDVQPESVEWKFTQTVTAVIEYLNVAEEALVKILNWLAPGTVEAENAGLTNDVVNLALTPGNIDGSSDEQPQPVGEEATTDREATKKLTTTERDVLLNGVLDGVTCKLWDAISD